VKNAARFFLVLPILLCSSCVANRAYRWGSNNPPSLVLAGTPSGSGGPNYDLAYLEFDDMGELWTLGNLRDFKDQPHASQLSEVLALIKQRRQSGNLIVIAFIHGWHNNASVYDEQQAHGKSLAGFKSLLQNRATSDPKHSYLGIFIAWRGQALDGDLFLTYWNRRDAANRVSSPSVSEAVFRLMFATKGTAGQPDPSNGCQPSDTESINSQFIIIGHSFGARILEGAVAQPFLTMLLERESQTRNCIEEAKRKGLSVPSGGAFRSPADMIVLLNSANDAFKTKAMIEAMKRMNLKVMRPSGDSAEQLTQKARSTASAEMDSYGPLILSITSRGDWATGRLMPVAQTISGLDERFRSYDKDGQEVGQDVDHPQRFYFRHNEGNVPEFRTHSVKPTKTPDCPPKAQWPYFKGEDGCYLVEPLHRWNDTPFWVMTVSTHIIPNHTDVFKPNLVDLLEAVLDRYSTSSTVTHLLAE
jgi:hypothetical protein